jgi:hypothetical protein
MNKLVMAAGIILILLASCRKTVQSIEATVEPLSGSEQRICGTDHTGNMMPEDFKQQLLLQRTTSAFPELLIYLDFDGEPVRPGFPTTTPGVTTSLIISSTKLCPAPVLTQGDINTVIGFIEDDFSPFNIKFTTSRAEYDGYAPGQRLMCIFTTDPSVIGQSNILGVAPFVAAGVMLANQPCFVFCTAIANFANNHTDDNKFISSVGSQELAHLLGLEHQHQFSSSCNFLSEFNGGSGTGPLGFSPIMGVGNKRISNWWGQSCQAQNDFNAINQKVELKPDDFPDSPGEWTSTGATTIVGTLGHPGDVDFIFVQPLSPVAVSATSENIDLKISFCTPGGVEIASADNPEDTNALLGRIAGIGFLRVEAASNANLSSQFMTGNYSITFLNK